MKQAAILSILLIPFIFLSSCNNSPKEAKLQITKQEFTIRKDGVVWVVDAKGKIKNIGEVDVKNVEVTGYCRSCGMVMVSNVWYVDDYEKMPEQKYNINHIQAGTEEEFIFKNVAYYFDSSSGPEKLPEKLECVIVSYEIIE